MASSEQKKSGARLNLFDIVLILAVLLCIAGIVLHAYFTKDLTDDYSQTATISFVVSGVSEETAMAFSNPGSPIYDAKTDKKLGMLAEASYTALTVQVEDGDGRLTSATHPDKKVITGTATLVGNWTEDGFHIDGSTPAFIGKTVSIYTDSAVCTITITGVNR